MDKRTRCPDCDADMEAGFVPDLTHGGYDQARWHRGEPTQKTFLGLAAGMAVSKESMMPIRAMRCVSCGLVRLYAIPGRRK